ncbi:MAG: hypothetical protein ACO31H_07730, partial [Bacteroidia bacterium]
MRILGLFVILFSLGWTDFALSNNLTVTNVALRNRNTTAGPNDSSNFAFIQASLRWENSWRINTGPANYDAVWVFAKYRVGTEDPVMVGANSSGTTVTVPTTASLRVGMPVVLTGAPVFLLPIQGLWRYWVLQHLRLARFQRLWDARGLPAGSYVVRL